MANESKTPVELLAPPNDEGNLRVFQKVWQTDPDFSKKFNRGGFQGTQTNPTYNIMRATAAFGPIGIGWGYDEVWHEIVEHEAVTTIVKDTDPQGNVIATKQITYPKEMVYINYVRVWYIDPLTNARAEVFQSGGTPMLFYDKRGANFDDEAPKKAITDGMQKCLAAIGFSADIHMGRYDDAKYVEESRAKFRTARGLPNEPSGGRPPQGGGNRPPQGNQQRGQRPPAGNGSQGGSNAGRAPQGGQGGPASNPNPPPADKPPANNPAPGPAGNAGNASGEPKRPSEIASGTATAQESEADKIRREQAEVQNNRAMTSICGATTRARLAEIRGNVKDPRRALTEVMRSSLLKLCDEREAQLPPGA